MKTLIGSNLTKGHKGCWILLFGLLCMFLSSCVGHRLSPVVYIPPLASMTQAAAEEDSEFSSGQIRLRDGTSLYLMTTESISSKRAKVGDHVKLRAVGGVKVGDLFVIANKAPAVATITKVQKAGLAWHSGSITMSPELVTLVNGQQVPLEPTPITELGRENKPTAQEIEDVFKGDPTGLSLVFLPFSPLQHGEQAIQPRGTVVAATIQANTILERASIESSQPETPKRDKTSASLTIYYPEFAPKGSVTVWCGVARVGKLHRGRRLNLKLPPGTYWLRSKEGKLGGVSYSAEAGGDDYMEIRSPKGEVAFPVDRDLGEALATFTLPADTKDVRDLTKTPLSDLQKQEEGGSLQ